MLVLLVLLLLAQTKNFDSTCKKEDTGRLRREYQLYSDAKKACNTKKFKRWHHAATTSMSQEYLASTEVWDRGVNDPIEDPQTEAFFCDSLELEGNATMCVKKTHNPSDPNEVWVFFRMGVFETIGGWSWISAEASDVFRTLYKGNVFKRSQDLFMTAMVYDAVWENGTTIGWPPIHRHHMHMMDEDDALTRVFARHGDDECFKGQGSTDCFLQLAPDGYGYPFPKKVNVDWEYNDVRTYMSDPIRWYYQLAVKLTDRKLKPVFNMRVANSYPHFKIEKRMRSWHSLETFFAPHQRPSVYWQAVYIPVDMEIYRIQMHRHSFDGVQLAVYYVFATPEELGFNEKPFVMRKPWVPLVLDTMEDLLIFQKRLLQKMDAVDDKIMCKMNDPAVEEGTQFGRKMLPCCKLPAVVKKNTPFTVIWLFKPSKVPPPRPYGLPHHGITFFDFKPLEENQGKYLTILGCDELWCQSTCHDKCIHEMSFVQGGIPQVWPDLRNNPDMFSAENYRDRTGFNESLLETFNDLDFLEKFELVKDKMVPKVLLDKMNAHDKLQSNVRTYYNEPLSLQRYAKQVGYVSTKRNMEELDKSLEASAMAPELQQIFFRTNVFWIFVVCMIFVYYFFVLRHTPQYDTVSKEEEIECLTEGL